MTEAYTERAYVTNDDGRWIVVHIHRLEPEDGWRRTTYIGVYTEAEAHLIADALNKGKT